MDVIIIIMDADYDPNDDLGAHPPMSYILYSRGIDIDKMAAKAIRL